MKRKILRPAIVGTLIFFIFAIFAAAIASSMIPGIGLRPSGGSLSVFRDGEVGGFSLLLEEANAEEAGLFQGKCAAWGFFEWSDRRLYGFLSFDAKAGNLRKGTVTSGTGKGSAVELKYEGSGRSLSVSFSGQGLKGVAPRLTRSSGGNLPKLLGFSGRMGRRFRLDALSNSPGGAYPFLDARLRRGESPQNYAADLLGRTSRTQGLEEKQFWLGSVNGKFSVATERDLSEGTGRTERFFGFTTVDVATGKGVLGNDLFKPGWKEALSPLLSREAKRILGANAGNGDARNGDTSGDLRACGLFEEVVQPSVGFFLCKSGIGFHYDRYELGPASLGEFAFVLPWKDLAGIMKKNGEPYGSPSLDNL